jgi:hypothetical protein
MCDRSTEDVHSSMASDPTSHFLVVPCCPTLDFVYVFWIMTTFDILLTLPFLLVV